MPSLKHRLLPSQLGLIAITVVGASCSQGKPAQLGQAQCEVSYEEQVQPILIGECGACHSDQSSEGDYRVDSYLAAVARRPDGTPRVSSGDEDSPLLQAARGNLPGGHIAIAPSEQELLQTWVTGCALKPSAYTFHSNGWMDPANLEEFHGRFLRSTRYDFGVCKTCHGDDLKGGQVNVSCETCHAGGVTQCNTCHGSDTNAAPPRDLEYLSATSRVGVGAHQSHVASGAQHVGFDCSACHVKPVSIEDEGHFQTQGVFDSSPAEVTFAAKEGASASWDHASATCTNSYCHAPSSEAGSGQPTMTWTAVGQGQATCGSCHGNPPANHSPDPDCKICHRPAYVGDEPRSAKHVNGSVELAASEGSCVGCHGNGTSPAPPSDLTGQSEETLLSVGAHRAHLEARHHVRGPIDCGECHVVPASLTSAGHIDSARPAEVFPIAAGVLARADGASPSYDANTGACTAYCHGAGERLSQDQSSGLHQSPVWNLGTDEATCGSCHGIPPHVTGSVYHSGVTQLTQCVSCHSASVTAGGAIKVTTDLSGQITSTHLNGTIEVDP